MANVKPIGGTFEDVGEAMAPIKDSVGEAIEQGVQSIVAPQLTPPPQQQKKPKSVPFVLILESKNFARFVRIHPVTHLLLPLWKTLWIFLLWQN